MPFNPFNQWLFLESGCKTSCRFFRLIFFRNPKLINLPRLGLSRAVSRELKPQKENGKNRIQTGHLNDFRPKKSLKYF